MIVVIVINEDTQSLASCKQIGGGKSLLLSSLAELRRSHSHSCKSLSISLPHISLPYLIFLVCQSYGSFCLKFVPLFIKVTPFTLWLSPSSLYVCILMSVEFCA